MSRPGDTVDQILTEEDAMYVKAFDDGTIPDTETLSLTHLPDRVCWPTVTANPDKPNQLPTASEATKLNESDTFKIILWKEQIGQLIQGQTQKFTNAYLVSKYKITQSS